MAYIDGFIVPVPKDRIDDYVKIASAAGEVWKEHGALSFTEAQADDVPMGELTSFPRAVQLAPDEVVFFSFITYRDRAHRDTVNAKVMADPRCKMDPATAPFSMQRMIWGGFIPRVAV